MWLSGVRPGRGALVDRTGKGLPCVGDMAWLWAASGGQPVDVAAEWDGRALRALGAMSGGVWAEAAP